MCCAKIINTSKMKKDIMKKINLVLESPTLASTQPNTDGICGDDDTPVGNIVFGTRSVRKLKPNRLTGKIPSWEVDDNFNWDDFDSTSGMENPRRYDDNILKNLERLIPNYKERHFKHLDKVGKKGEKYGTVTYTGVPRPKFDAKKFVKNPEGESKKSSKDLEKDKEEKDDKVEREKQGGDN